MPNSFTMRTDADIRKLPINRPVGNRVLITGGNEATPAVEVVSHDGGRVFRIVQEGEVVLLSVSTMREIIKWGCE